MNKPAAVFSAVYSDWKLIKTRSCVQVIFEIPLENANAVLDVLGGMPSPGNERWFAVARLDPAKVVQLPTRPKEKKDWDALPFPQQAGIIANEPAFLTYLHKCEGFDGDQAADGIRLLCEVASRKDIQVGTRAEKLWRDLVSRYRTWLHEPEYA